MRWDEIPQFTSCRNYGVDCSLFRYFCEYIDREIAEGLVLNPDFQRGHVWTEEQQTAYIEYLLMGGMSGRTIYQRRITSAWTAFSALRQSGGFTAMRFRRSNIATVSLRGN